MKRKWILLSVLGCLFVLGILAFHRKQKSSSNIDYQEGTVARGDLQVKVLSTGVVEPENRLEIKPPVSGRVEDILVDEGYKVKKGQTLAQMSSTERAALLD